MSKVPCGGFELDDTFTIDKNGKLGISDNVVFKTAFSEIDTNKELRANMDISSIFDILKKSNNAVHFMILFEDVNTKLWANAISYNFGFVPDKGLVCYILFNLFFENETLRTKVEVDEKEKKAIITEIIPG